MTTRDVKAQDGDVENRRQLYMDYACYACHGYSAHGGQGPALGPEALSYQAFLGIIRSGGGGMPQYAEHLVPDHELADIYAFVRSVPSSPQAADLPLLQDGVGVYTQ